MDFLVTPVSNCAIILQRKMVGCKQPGWFHVGAVNSTEERQVRWSQPRPIAMGPE